MTNFGFVMGCTILAFGIWAAGYYINRAIQAAAMTIANVTSKKKLQ
jgi:hypothetical protein